MTNEEVAVYLAEDRSKIQNLDQRVEKCEKRDETLDKLTISVERLAISLESMVAEQKAQGTRLERLEQKPSEDFSYYKKLIIGCVATTIIGAVIGAVLANIM